MELSLLVMCSGTLAYKEEMYPDHGFHLNFAENKQTADLNGLVTGGGLRGMLETKNSYVVHTAFLFVAASMDRSRGFMERAGSTRRNI